MPLVYTALLGLRDRLGIDELVLHDVEQQRLDRIAPVLSGLALEKGVQLPFRSTTDLTDAIQGADFVLCAIRVGQLEGRVVDESVPLGFGVLGQETTGPGGLCFALRTIPVMMELARTIRQHAPNAWLINFTNPAGMVTEAVQRELGDRAIGICDSPAGLLRRVARALDRDPEDLWFDYFGLNHLGWLHGVRDHERDLLPDLLASDQRLSTFEEGRLFGGEWLRSLEMVPNEYLYYFYYAADTVNAIRESEDSRGSFLLRQQSAFYAEGEQPPAQALEQWRQTRHDRERTYMAEARSAAGDCHDTPRRRRQRRLRGRGDGGAGGDRAQLAGGPDPQHRQPLGAAVPRRARRRRGAVRRRPHRPGADRRRRGAAACARARRDDEGRRAHDDRRGALAARADRRSARSRCTRSSPR